MVIRLVLLSFCISIVNLLIVVTIPIDIPVNNTEKVVSPYREELNALKSRGLNEEENNRYLELLEKNNQFFINDMEQMSNSITATDIKDAWEKKFILLIPLHILIWCITSYFLLRKREVKHFYVLLSAPLVFFMVGIIPMSGILIITLAVLSVWFWSLIKQKSIGNK
ncbi:MAG: hypothetical protein COA34_015080 [Methylophaga sp.]|uniref:hypothetical protein n=1 Tax=Methylophaga sp. TaxID=2024840 RepID=UPI000C0EA12A|nr:hypothetical protein [Methylophaga sp.]MBL1459157.1 hypothetical protein [Methylophaga sp.]